MTLENLTYEVRDAVAHVAIDRPRSLNALNADTLSELRQVFEAIQADDAVRVAILTGVGEKAWVKRAPSRTTRSKAGVEIASYP